MKNLQSIMSQIEETLQSLLDWNNLEQFVDEFHFSWLKLGNFIQQQLVQARIAEGIMALRAAYLSNSNRWLNFWSPESKILERKLAYFSA